MRIAVIADGVYPYDHGGHQIRVHSLVKRYARTHEVDLYVQAKPGIDYPHSHEGASVIEIDSRIESPRLRLTVGGASYARRVASEVRDRDYDLVDVLFYCRTSLIDVPTVVTYGAFLQRWREISGLRERLINSVPTGIQYLLNRQSLSSADFVVALSERSHVELHEVFSPTVPTKVIKNGVDLEHFTPEGPTASLPDLGEYVGAFVGRLHDEKGVFELLEAVTRTEVDFGLVYVGSGPAREQLESRADELGIADRVSFQGFVEYERIPEYYRAVDVSLLPSYFEIQPLSCIESMACGTPVVASDIAGVRELVTDDETGILVPPATVAPIASAVDELCSSGALYDRIRSSGTAFAETRTWDRIAEQTLDVYETVLRGNAE
jgi:glycosyltransferase involved in cell wall biosynthesis